MSEQDTNEPRGGTARLWLVPALVLALALMQARLFTPFHRAANVAHVPGTGLGLVIVTQCVATHGGSVTLHSTPQGTEATVRLPLFAAQ